MPPQDFEIASRAGAVLLAALAQTYSNHGPQEEQIILSFLSELRDHYNKTHDIYSDKMLVAAIMKNKISAKALKLAASQTHSDFIAVFIFPRYFAEMATVRGLPDHPQRLVVERIKAAIRLAQRDKARSS